MTFNVFITISLFAVFIVKMGGQTDFYWIGNGYVDYNVSVNDPFGNSVIYVPFAINKCTVLGNTPETSAYDWKFQCGGTDRIYLCGYYLGACSTAECTDGSKTSQASVSAPYDGTPGDAYCAIQSDVTQNYIEIEFYTSQQSSSNGCPNTNDFTTHSDLDGPLRTYLTTDVCTQQPNDGRYIMVDCNSTYGSINVYTDGTCGTLDAISPLITYHRDCAYMFYFSSFWFRRMTGCYKNGTNILPPTSQPTKVPTHLPTTSEPSTVPTTSDPTKAPSNQPSTVPSSQPTDIPTTQQPTDTPITKQPTGAPHTKQPTGIFSTIGTTKAPETTQLSDASTTLKTTSEKDLVDTAARDEEKDNLNLLYQICAITFILIFIIIIFVGWIDAKYVRKNDYFKITIFGTMILQSMDLLSDCFFIGEININAQYDDTYVIPLYLSIAFIVLPAFAALLQIYFHSNKYWLKNDDVRAWMDKYYTPLLLLSILAGSSFSALMLVNSNIFQMELFDMGLTSKEQKRFKRKRIYSIVLLENIPQIGLQIWYIWFVGGLDNAITISSVIFSMISVIISVLSSLTTKNIMNTQQYAIITMDITGNSLLEKGQSKKCKTIRSSLEKDLGGLLGTNKKNIEFIKPEGILNGYRIKIYLYINNTNNKTENDYKNTLITASDNGSLQNAFKTSWKLNSAISIDNVNVKFVTSKDQRILSESMHETQIINNEPINSKDKLDKGNDQTDEPKKDIEMI